MWQRWAREGWQGFRTAGTRVLPGNLSSRVILTYGHIEAKSFCFWIRRSLIAALMMMIKNWHNHKSGQCNNSLSKVMIHCWSIINIITFMQRFAVTKLVQIEVNYFGKIKCIILGCWQAGMVYSAAAGAPNPRRPTLMPIDSKTSSIQPPRFHKKSITGTFMRMQINIFYVNSLVCKQTYGTVSTHVSVSDQLYIFNAKIQDMEIRFWEFWPK